MKLSNNLDIAFMQLALDLAKQGEFTAHPNPRVGCVMVKAGQVVATGLHWQSGGNHAEVNALNQADCHGATCYVTLEPCAHEGKTPPCVQALIAAKVKHVIMASIDPNPLVKGKGLQALKDAGIKVSVGLLEEKAVALNKGYYSRMQRGIPFVRAKIGMSLDGKIAMKSGESQWITSSTARNHAHFWRARSGAIVTSSQTVLKDNCRLTVRKVKDLNLPEDITFSQPLRVLVDAQLKVGSHAAIFQEPGKTIIATTLKQGKLLNHEIDRVVLPEKNDHVDLKALLLWLGEMQINDVLVEAGSCFVGALLDQDLIDELLIYVAPKFLGNEGIPLAKLQFSKLNEVLCATFTHVEKLDPDLFIRMSLRECKDDNQCN